MGRMPTNNDCEEIRALRRGIADTTRELAVRWRAIAKKRGRLVEILEKPARPGWENSKRQMVARYEAEVRNLVDAVEVVESNLAGLKESLEAWEEYVD